MASLKRYLRRDSEYQSVLRDLARSLGDYRARQTIEKNRSGTEYGFAKRLMGQQQTNDLGDMKDDFAARGIVNSGVYAGRVGEYNTQYGQKVAELTRNYGYQKQDYASSYRDYLRQQSFQKEAARQAAIRRRAAKLGL